MTRIHHMRHLLMTRSLRSVPKVRPAGMLQYSTAYREECVWKRLSVLNAKGNFVAFTTVLLTPLLPSCVYIKINPPPPSQGPAASHRLTFRPRTHFPGFDRPAADRADESTTWNFSSNIPGSNRPFERPRTL